MKPDDLLRAGKLKEAIQAVSGEIRDHPTDARRRTFLFELLCFAGEFDRAAKHLSVLAQAGRDAEMGALLYRSALAAERKRHAFFAARAWAESGTQAVSEIQGTVNGRPFHSLEDADPRIGPRLEVFVAGEYLWLPFAHIASVKFDAPRTLRDLLWATARISTGPELKGQDFGEVLAPVLCPGTPQDPSDEVKLGRVTEWRDLDEVGSVPVGQKLLVIDGGEDAIPFLEIRELVIE
jgi:type VI secretion system protein ImpE